jgi:hypothetical protein
MIEALVYFASPRTVWQSKVAEEDIIFRRAVPWLWMARWLARSTHAPLDPHRCGWLVMRDGEVIEHVEPDLIASSGPSLNEQLAESERAQTAERVRANVLRRFRQRHFH